MTQKNTVSEHELREELRSLTILDSGRSEKQVNGDLREEVWWEFPPEAEDELENLREYTNISLRVKNPSPGPDADDTLRLVLEHTLMRDVEGYRERHRGRRRNR